MDSIRLSTRTSQRNLRRLDCYVHTHPCSWRLPVSNLECNYGSEALVQLTAVYGWPSVPEPITQAVIIQASRIFKRYDSPLGVAGFGDLGAIRVTRALDPDVAQLVEPYRRMRMFA